ncbi:MAG TPA: hypothetical protein VGA03_08405 [Anaerolineales bacterium]
MSYSTSWGRHGWDAQRGHSCDLPAQDTAQDHTQEREEPAQFPGGIHPLARLPLGEVEFSLSEVGFSLREMRFLLDDLVHQLHAFLLGQDQRGSRGRTDKSGQWESVCSIQ